MKKINFLIQKALLLLTVLCISISAYAEGSKDLYPAGTTGGRASPLNGLDNYSEKRVKLFNPSGTDGKPSINTGNGNVMNRDEEVADTVKPGLFTYGKHS